MATTELHKVLPTIQSRSQRLIFEKLSREDILHVLARIARAEQLDIADDALDIIARAGRGSLRDAESVLNGIAVIADGTITADAVKQLLNMADFSQALEFLSAILSGNAIQALDMVEDLARRSLNEEEFLKYCILILEKTLIITQTKNEGLLEDSFTTEEIYDLTEFGKRFAQTTMLTVVRILLEYYANIKDYPSPLMALEMATIEALAANGTSEQSVSDKNKHDRSGGSALSSDDAATHSAAQPSAHNSTINKIHFSTVAALKKIQDNWAGIVEDLKPFNYSLAALFGAATLVNLVGDELIIRVKYGFHKERLEETKNRLEIERILQEVSGEKLHLACVVGEDEQAQSAANASSASATHQPSAPAYTY
jgi:DNA polymerase-3 subunit gamma/tau